ncbi:TPA: YbaB/EbfC family nucleoid-associated protein [Patescibacteria group bacterium]|uniref:Nucleoid-associated protein n=1 Tax=Candidatus Gottesmanbacteria bacterium GW2011_GWA1_43_11 TaxID=1618436 RepID=A0A0G1CEV5_9BACT|nr:MAG: hypothetical protein UV59_C0028G0002 [Candidatus Gottesmanbacteria bacterium GW2011_GWA1_43_11]HCS78403.1 YbaB/EbfC family nucleoid-associated protein [Patescibacteria group bacterium]
MQNPLKMLGDLNKMRAQAAQIQKELEKLEFTTSQGRITVVITGTQQIVSIKIDGQDVPELTAAVNDAIRQSQQAAAAKMQDVSKQLGIG